MRPLLNVILRLRAEHLRVYAALAVNKLVARAKLLDRTLAEYGDPVAEFAA